MSNRAFACLHCRKLQRKDQNIAAFFCPLCGRESVRVHWKLHVPAPRKVRKWNQFWDRYLSERRQLLDFQNNPSMQELYLPLLNQLHRKRPR